MRFRKNPQEVCKFHSMGSSGTITYHVLCGVVQFMQHKMASMCLLSYKLDPILNRTRTKLGNEMVSNHETLVPQRSSLLIIWPSKYAQDIQNLKGSCLFSFYKYWCSKSFKLFWDGKCLLIVWHLEDFPKIHTSVLSRWRTCLNKSWKLVWFFFGGRGLALFFKKLSSAFWKQTSGNVSILTFLCCQKDVEMSIIKTLMFPCQQFSNCGLRTLESS